MNVEPHRVNGRFFGAWYSFDDGSGLYLAHRRLSQVYKKKTAWCLDRTTLEMTRDRGFKVVGVAVKQGKRVHYYMTPVDDFFGPHSFLNYDNMLQRGLPLNRFRITPSHVAANVARAIKIR